VPNEKITKSLQESQRCARLATRDTDWAGTTSSSRVKHRQTEREIWSDKDVGWPYGGWKSSLEFYQPYFEVEDSQPFRNVGLRCKLLFTHYLLGGTRWRCHFNTMSRMQDTPESGLEVHPSDGPEVRNLQDKYHHTPFQETTPIYHTKQSGGSYSGSYQSLSTTLS